MKPWLNPWHPITRCGKNSCVSSALKWWGQGMGGSVTLHCTLSSRPAWVNLKKEKNGKEKNCQEQTAQWQNTPPPPPAWRSMTLGSISSPGVEGQRENQGSHCELALSIRRNLRQKERYWVQQWVWLADGTSWLEAYVGAVQKTSSQTTCLSLYSPRTVEEGKSTEKKVRSPKGRELFVLKDYLLGLSLIFWIFFLI